MERRPRFDVLEVHVRSKKILVLMDIVIIKDEIISI